MFVRLGHMLQWRFISNLHVRQACRLAQPYGAKQPLQYKFTVGMHTLLLCSLFTGCVIPPLDQMAPLQFSIFTKLGVGVVLRVYFIGPKSALDV